MQLIHNLQYKQYNSQQPTATKTSRRSDCFARITWRSLWHTCEHHTSRASSRMAWGWVTLIILWFRRDKTTKSTCHLQIWNTEKRRPKRNSSYKSTRFTLGLEPWDVLCKGPGSRQILKPWTSKKKPLSCASSNESRSQSRIKLKESTQRQRRT